MTKKLTEEEKLKRKYARKINDFIAQLEEEGMLMVAPDHETNKPFIIWYSWQPIYRLNTFLAVISNAYSVYQKAIDFEDTKERGWNHSQEFQIGKKKYKTIHDVRLGRNGLFPGDDEPYYLIPDSVQLANDVFEEIYPDWGFHDEYDTCSQCGKVMRFSPDSYGWTPDYVDFSWGDRTHVDCCDVEDVLSDYNHKRKSLPDAIYHRAFQEDIIEKIESWEDEQGRIHDIYFENGMHHGQNDDPGKIAKALKAGGVMDWWWDVQPSQFDVRFYVIVRKEDVEKATEILKDVDAYQGYDGATELSKALKGLPTEHYHVETTIVDMSDPETAKKFIDGTLFKKEEPKEIDDNEEE